MVVIVIMGILAAVAVPKLFGMIAKSKASEIGTAAGSYVKLQDAYVAEAGAMGDWGKIGYAMKNGDTFDYSDPNSGSYSNNSVLVESLGEAGKKGWQAKSKVKLNDCQNAAVWDIKLTAAGNSAQGMVSYTTSVSDGPAGNTNACRDLTPSFKKLDSESNS
jgi:type II secretory pathway pseudopilin PulG